MATKIKIGDTVRCTSAASNWFTVGQCYLVVKHPDNGYSAVKASDGLYDLLSMASSKFEKVEPCQE